MLLGDSGVGKTSLGYQYAEEKALYKPELTVGFDYWRKEVEIEGEIVKVSYSRVHDRCVVLRTGGRGKRNFDHNEALINQSRLKQLLTFYHCFYVA